VTARYDALAVLHDVDLTIHRGEIVALMGRNGVGKSTLLRLLSGLGKPATGRVMIDGIVPQSLHASARVRKVGLVSAATATLSAERTIGGVCTAADSEYRLVAGTTRLVLDHLVPGLDPRRRARDLSEGERLAIALAIVIAPAPPLVLLDEPTRGLDYSAKAQLADLMRELAATGQAVVLASHDVELIADVATRAIVLADGGIVADGPAREVVCHSPLFAPQVAKVLAPGEWLTVAEVSAALAS
jgi:energy-coupling factor transport system ATP-binding protein